MTRAATMPRISPISAVIASLVFGSMAIGTFIAFILAVILPYVRTGTLPADWNLTKVTVALLLIVVLYAYLGFTIYQAFRIGFSEHGVSVLTLIGGRLIPWSNIRRVGFQGHRVLLDTPNGKVVVNLVCFADAKGVVAYLAERLAPYAARQASDAG